MTLLSPDTVAFLTALRANNDRHWFEAHKDDYDAQLKQPGQAFAAALAAALESGTGEAHAWKIFRIHRDVRFSRDKTPYNSHLHISLSPNGDCENGGPVWMFGLDPDGLTLGAGIFAFSKPQLEAWRARVAGPEGQAVEQLLAELAQDGIRLSEPELKRVPAPYPAEHPRSHLLRHKGLTAWIDCGDARRAFGKAGPANCAGELMRLRTFAGLLRAL